MWDTNVECVYERTYNEKLPSSWFDFAKGCDYFHVPNPNIKIIDTAPVKHIFFVRDI